MQWRNKASVGAWGCGSGYFWHSTSKTVESSAQPPAWWYSYTKMSLALSVAQQTATFNFPWSTSQENTWTTASWFGTWSRVYWKILSHLSASWSNKSKSSCCQTVIRPSSRWQISLPFITDLSRCTTHQYMLRRIVTSSQMVDLINYYYSLYMYLQLIT